MSDRIYFLPSLVDKEQREKLFHKWCIKGGQLYYTKRAFDNAVYEKGFEAMKEEIK